MKNAQISSLMLVFSVFVYSLIAYSLIGASHAHADPRTSLPALKKADMAIIAELIDGMPKGVDMTGAEFDWKNPDSGNAGKLVLNEVKEVDDARCQVFMNTFTIRGESMKRNLLLSRCEREDSSRYWLSTKPSKSGGDSGKARGKFTD